VFCAAREAISIGPVPCRSALRTDRRERAFALPIDVRLFRCVPRDALPGFGTFDFRLEAFCINPAQTLVAGTVSSTDEDDARAVFQQSG
jgi:hypothetical protein